MSKHQADLAKLTADRTRLQTKQTTAQVALDRAIDADSKFLLTGDNDETIDNKRKDAVKHAQAELARYERPLATLAPQIIEVENTIALETLTVARDKGGKKLGEQTDAIKTRRIVWLESTLELIAALDAVAPAYYEMGQVAGFLRNACSEVEVAIDVGVPNLRAFADQIRDGHMPIPRGRSVIEAKQPAPATPKVTAVFAMHALTWLDDAGAQRILGKWHDIELPEAAAAFALQARLAVLPNDPMAAKVRGQSTGHPASSWLNNLDTKVGPNIAGSPTASIDGGTVPPPSIERKPYVIRYREAIS
jgi:hypothetical protein